MKSDTINKLARMAAIPRLHELATEINEITTVFPELATLLEGTIRKKKKAKKAAKPPKAKAVRHRKPMTAAQRKAVSARMKKYWAERRKE